jgi:hypothetical protein
MWWKNLRTTFDGLAALALRAVSLRSSFLIHFANRFAPQNFGRKKNPSQEDPRGIHFAHFQLCV